MFSAERFGLDLAPFPRLRALRERCEALPAFAAMVAIPFTFNIAHGVAAGIVAHVAVKAGAGRAREVSRVAWVLAVLVLAAYALLPRLRH